ncbi:MAG TPA: M90 family metallopeptidase [Gemmata sp.]|nr:M90 family metallopeptidase [Gemmata sp.]
MLFSWLRTRRRRRLLAEPFPVRSDAIIGRNVGHFPLLSAAEQDRLRDVARVLLAEKRWHGRGGLFVGEEMRVTIAAQAALLLLGSDRGYFRRVRDVYVFPTEFRTPVYDDDWEDDGLSERPLAGQAVYTGPVMLAWDQVLPEGRDPAAGHNVVLHEFAHQLDFTEGVSGGTPDLGDRELESRWKYVMAVAFEDHRRAIREGRDALFTPHAADNEAEFFADATEAFYCRAEDLKEFHPEVYRLLAAYYRVDPAAWFARA